VPIHDASYQHWRGIPSERAPAWILARAELRLLLARRVVRFLLAVSAIFALVWAAMIYLETRLPDAGPLREASRLIRVDAHSLALYLTKQRLLQLLLCLAAGADLIALDRRHKALQIYLARPLRRRDYLFGKGLALAILLSLMTWVPACLLLLLKVIVSADVRWLLAQPWLPLSILGYSAALIGACTLLTLASSSLSASPRLASAQLFAFLALTSVAAQVLSALTRSARWHLLSIVSDLDQLASWLFGEPLRFEFPAWSALAALVLLGAGCAALLRARVRPIDVVGGS